MPSRSREVSEGEDQLPAVAQSFPALRVIAYEPEEAITTEPHNDQETSKIVYEAQPSESGEEPSARRSNSPHDDGTPVVDEDSEELPGPVLDLVEHLKEMSFADDPDQLMILGQFMLCGFRDLDQGDTSFIDQAINFQSRALFLTPDGHPSKPGRICSLADAYQLRFTHLGELEDLERAILCRSEAGMLVPDDHPEKPRILIGLASAYFSRVERLGEHEDLEHIILCLHGALLFTPDDDEERLPRLKSLGSAYRFRFEHLKELSDIDKAGDYAAQALLLTPDGHPNRPNVLRSLGDIHLDRFKHLGELSDLCKAIDYEVEAISLVPDGHTDKPAILRSLGSAYQVRFDYLGELADINKALECRVHAASLIPDGHPDRAGVTSDLGASYESRFKHLGELSDVEKAIDFQAQAVSITPDNHEEKPTWLSNLGNAYLSRFEKLGDISDVNKAIEYQLQADSLAPSTHAYKPNILSSLGSSYRRIFQHRGQLSDVNNAIDRQIQAVLLTPDGHVDRPGRLGNLGNSYLCRFDHLGDLIDLDKAIDSQIQAAALTPEDRADKPLRLSNSGTAYLRRFEVLGELPDVNKAIEYFDRVVSLTPDGHADKPGRLSDLASAYTLRFKDFLDMCDIEKAIECYTHALLLITDGDMLKPGIIGNLGAAYQSRFEHRGELSDINRAIQYLTQAISLTPDGHAYKAIRQLTIGNSYRCRYEQQSAPEDMEKAITNLSQAAHSNTSPASTKFHAARNWARLSSQHDLSSVLRAYTRTMELVPQMAWLGTKLDQRYKPIFEMGNVAVEAAASAIALKDYEHALEWLEQGRSIVWNQILQLRAPFDDLSAKDPVLASQMKQVSRELESAGSQPSVMPLSPNDALDVEKAAKRHHDLAFEWDQLLDQARRIPGLEDFMRPHKASELMRVAKHGPVVVINVHESRCDALILRPDSSEIAHVPLEHFSSAKALKVREQLAPLTGYRGFAKVKNMNLPKEDMPKPEQLLEDLWWGVVKPVLDFLGYIRKRPQDELPHLTWCTTGPLSFLPLHAAGCYNDSQPKIFEFVISSYTPTLSALLAPTSKNRTSASRSSMLAVGQEYTKGLSPLPYTQPELAAIKEHAKPPTCYFQLDGDKAIVEAVLNGMDQHSWVHLACHATQHTEDPAQSAFHLHDGNLTISAIIKRAFKNKGLAYLSACQTATGYDRLPDEAVHLAAAMLMAGYPSVIATMWSIYDEDGPAVAGQVYAELLKDGRMDLTDAARALHKAVDSLREKVGIKALERWVPFIHIGS